MAEAKKSLLSKIVDAVKFILDLTDDLIVALKEMLPMGEKLMRGVMGATFGVLCFYLAYEAAKHWWEHFHQAPSKNRSRRLKREALTFLISLGASGLALALMIAAWSSLPVLGVAFFPFAITTTLLIASFLHCVNLYFDLQEANDEDKKHKSRELNYQLLDFAAFVLIVLGLGLGTFITLTGFLAAIELPLALIAVGAIVGVASKLHEHKRFYWMYRLSALCGGVGTALFFFITIPTPIFYLSVSFLILGAVGMVFDYCYKRGDFLGPHPFLGDPVKKGDVSEDGHLHKPDNSLTQEASSRSSSPSRSGSEIPTPLASPVVVHASSEEAKKDKVSDGEEPCSNLPISSNSAGSFNHSNQAARRAAATGQSQNSGVTVGSPLNGIEGENFTLPT